MEELHCRHYVHLTVPEHVTLVVFALQPLPDASACRTVQYLAARRGLERHNRRQGAEEIVLGELHRFTDGDFRCVHLKFTLSPDSRPGVSVLFQ